MSLPFMLCYGFTSYISKGRQRLLLFVLPLQFTHTQEQEKLKRYDDKHFGLDFKFNQAGSRSW